MLVNSGESAGDAQWARGSTDDAADLGVCWGREGIKMKSRQIQKICSRLNCHLSVSLKRVKRSFIVSPSPLVSRCTAIFMHVSPKINASTHLAVVHRLLACLPLLLNFTSSVSLYSLFHHHRNLHLSALCLSHLFHPSHELLLFLVLLSFTCCLSRLPYRTLAPPRSCLTPLHQPSRPFRNLATNLFRAW